MATSSDMPAAARRTPRRTAGRRDLDAFTPRPGPAHRATVSSMSTNAKQARRKRASGSGGSLLVPEIEAADREPLPPPSSGKPRSAFPPQAVPSPKRRKYTTKPPSQPQETPTSQPSPSDPSRASPATHLVHIVPLRAILDDRVKRRIRRNGLSEEMHVIYSERRSRAKRSLEEMARLRDQLVAKEAENELLREQSSLLQDTSRILELESEIAHLKQGMHSSHGHGHHDDWDMAAGDGYSDSETFPDTDDHFFRDDTTVQADDTSSLVPATQYMDAASRALTPPSSSPAKPREALAAHEQFQAQLKARLPAGAPADGGTEHAADLDHQLQMDIMVQTLADKTAALAALTTSIASLGAPGSEASNVLRSLHEAFHAARQELQELCSTDDPPLPPAGTCGTGPAPATELLPQLLQRVRAAAAHAKQSEAALAAHRTSLAEAKGSLLAKDAELAGMEGSLKAMIAVAAERQARLAQVHADWEGDVRARAASHAEEMERARAAVACLQADRARVQAEADRERKAARDAVTALRTQLLQSLQVSEAFLA